MFYSVHRSSLRYSLLYRFLKGFKRKLFLTLYFLVVASVYFREDFAFCAPGIPSVDIDLKKSENPVMPPAQSTEKIETLSPNSVPEQAHVEDTLEEFKTYFHKYEESLSFRLGGNHDFGSPSDEEDDQSSAQFGFQYMFESHSKIHLEAGFDLFPKREEFLVHAGMKVVELFTESFRPYYKIGAAIKLDSGDTINTPLKTENYFILGSLGFEDLITDPISFRVDMDLFYGKENALFVLSAGVSYSF